jgi:P27 family predicted phage terminase small subunit
MAVRGRKPKPNELKILEGSRADRVNQNAPEAIREPLERPDHLDEDARAEWDRLLPQLERMGVISQTDSAVLALYCVAFSRWLSSRAELLRHGLVIETDLGGTKANPAAAIVAKCEDQMARLLAELGCTPSSRGRLDRLKADAQPDEFEELLTSKPKRKA